VVNDGPYDPTIGVRILEFEREITAKTRDGKATVDVSVQVELWDASGDQKYEPCWPSIMKDLNGVIICFDPTSKQQAYDVRIWCEWFCKNADLESDQAVIFAHGQLVTQHKPFIVKAGKRSVIVPIVNVNLGNKSKVPQSGPQSVLKKPSMAEIEFNNFLGSVYAFHPAADMKDAAPLAQPSPGAASASPHSPTVAAGVEGVPPSENDIDD